jgi:hypothetical protein
MMAFLYWLGWRVRENGRRDAKTSTYQCNAFDANWVSVTWDKAVISNGSLVAALDAAPPSDF